MTAKPGFLRVNSVRQRRLRSDATASIWSTRRNAGPPSTHVAHGPNEVWTGDISWLPTCVRGMFFYLYLLVDIYC